MSSESGENGYYREGGSAEGVNDEPNDLNISAAECAEKEAGRREETTNGQRLVSQTIACRRHRGGRELQTSSMVGGVRNNSR